MKGKGMEDKKFTGLGVVLGISIGLVIGGVTDDTSMWLAVGISIGLVIGVGLDFQRNKKKDK